MESPAPATPVKLEWRKIGETRYSVSNFGEIRNDRTGRILKQGHLSDGKRNVKLMMTYNPRDKPVTIQVSRLVARAFLPNPDNKSDVDHIDPKQPDNNHISNLRWATHSENCYNRSKPSNNSSGSKGVYFHKPTNCWMAYLGVGTRQNYLGIFPTVEEAKAYRDEMATYVHGEFARS